VCANASADTTNPSYWLGLWRRVWALNVGACSIAIAVHLKQVEIVNNGCMGQFSGPVQCGGLIGFW
jgi:hypothetical protein